MQKKCLSSKPSLGLIDCCMDKFARQAYLLREDEGLDLANVGHTEGRRRLVYVYHPCSALLRDNGELPSVRISSYVEADMDMFPPVK